MKTPLSDALLKIVAMALAFTALFARVLRTLTKRQNQRARAL